MSGDTRIGAFLKRTPLKRKTALKRVSKKRQAIQEQRRDFVSQQLSKRTRCEAGEIIGMYLMGLIDAYGPFHKITVLRAPHVAGCLGYSTELHEPLTRARAPGAETILDPKNSIAICRNCHRWTHDNVAAATELGLLIHSWEAQKWLSR